MIRFLIYILAAVAFFEISSAQDIASLNEKGNTAYSEKKYDEALELYNKAEENKADSPEILYNKGNTLQKMQSYNEAIENYSKAIVGADTSLAAKTYYNGGNCYYKMQKPDKAVEWYKKALELNPDDKDAKMNLESALRMLEEMPKQQNQKGNDKSDDKNNDKQDKKNDENKNGEKGQKQDSTQTPRPDSSGESQMLTPADSGQAGDTIKAARPDSLNQDQMSREDALRILNAFKDDEKEVQKYLVRSRKLENHSKNDW